MLISDWLALRAMVAEAKRADDAAPVRPRLAGGRLLVLRPGLPGPTRASCPPPDEPCPYVRCRHHLAILEGDDRRGRRHAGKAPPSTLRPIWTEPDAPTCSLHEADRAAAEGQPMPIEVLAGKLGLRPSRVHEILAKCADKIRTLGIDQ